MTTQTTAADLIKNPLFTWLISHSSSQIDSEGNPIPASAFFSGRLSYGMTQALKDKLTQAGANRRDAGSRIYYSLVSGETEKDFSVSVSFGAHKSTETTIIFNLTPFTW